MVADADAAGSAGAGGGPEPRVMEGFAEWQSSGHATSTKKGYASAIKKFFDYQDIRMSEGGGAGAVVDYYMEGETEANMVWIWNHFGMYLNRTLKIHGKSWLSIRSAVKSCLAARLRHERFASDVVSGKEARQRATKLSKDEARRVAEKRDASVKLPAFAELESVLYRRTFTNQGWDMAGRRARSVWIAAGLAGITGQRVSSVTSSSDADHAIAAEDTVLCLRDEQGREVFLQVGDPWPEGVLFNSVYMVRFRFCTNKGYAEASTKNIPGVDDRSWRYILSLAEYVFMTPELQPGDPLATAYSRSEGRRTPILTRRECTARDLNGHIKDAAAELKFPRSHFSSTSLRKWGPTEGSSAGADGGYSQAMGGWKSSSVMTTHYNKAGLSYQPIGARGGVGLTADVVRAMLPVAGVRAGAKTRGMTPLKVADGSGDEAAEGE